MDSENYYVYVIRSYETGRYYTGYTRNPGVRLRQHNDGWTRSTKGGIPWEIVHLESFSDKASALRREREIKARRSHKYIAQLIHSEGPAAHTKLKVSGS